MDPITVNKSDTIRIYAGVFIVAFFAVWLWIKLHPSSAQNFLSIILLDKKPGFMEAGLMAVSISLVFGHLWVDYIEKRQKFLAFLLLGAFAGVGVWGVFGIANSVWIFFSADPEKYSLGDRAVLTFVTSSLANFVTFHLIRFCALAGAILAALIYGGMKLRDKSQPPVI